MSKLRGLSVMVAVAAACLGGAAQAGQTFDAVKGRKAVVCGVHTGLAGFGAPDSQGNWTGLDVDVCRAVAAAVLGDPAKVKFVPLSAQQRFTALQSGEIDLLSRNTTWTLSRDASLGMNFTVTTFYDGQGFMVAKKSGVAHAKELNGATVCVQTGTTTEQNLADFARANKLDLKPVVIEKFEEATGAFFSGRCDAMSSDTSQLAAMRAANAPNPADYVILPELISKEPLTPAVRRGDDEWFGIVKWAIYAMIEAEERGITTKNVDEALKSTDPNVQRMLGVTPGMGKLLGLDDKWAYNLIKSVGNYGEVFERNVGKNSPLKLERGVNALWTQGGLMYAMPIR